MVIYRKSFTGYRWILQQVMVVNFKLLVLQVVDDHRGLRGWL